ncbi:hypothetical protein ERJ75_000385400 [Trypanosoma vivax]|nr:hypothetical protein ERJ75_000385400 [Trypanosoma vivax]
MATSFEELSIIRDRQDFTLPQINRIINSGGRGGGDSAGCGSGARGDLVVVHTQSSLCVEVLEPTSHPILVPRDQLVVRVLARADPVRVEFTATVTSTTDPVPDVPELDSELLLVQRSSSDINHVEILLDVRAARCRWACQPVLVHLFERKKSLATVEPYANIGFVRVTPTHGTTDGSCECANSAQTLYQRLRSYHDHYQPTLETRSGAADGSSICIPAVLSEKFCRCPVGIGVEPCGWPVVTNDFNERCATVIEPLCGMWSSTAGSQRVAIHIPRGDYMREHIEAVYYELLREQRHAEHERQSNSQDRAKASIKVREMELEEARRVERETADSLQQEIAQVQKSMVRRRGKELAKLKRLEDELQQQLGALRDRVAACHRALQAAEQQLALLGRDNAVRRKRCEQLQEECERLAARAERDTPLTVEVVLVAEENALFVSNEGTRLYPVDTGGVLYQGTVPVLTDFCGRAVLLVNGQEAVRWEVRPAR